jgi:hypothetical protein
MNTVAQVVHRPAEARTETQSSAEAGARQAFRILRVGFTVAPIIAGLDKFFHLLTDWDKYLPSAVSGLVGGRGHELMLAVGVIEIAAGVGVALKPRIFAYVVAAWLWLIVLNLLMVPGYLDVALRDFGLSLAALALGRLSTSFDSLTDRHA